MTETEAEYEAAYDAGSEFDLDDSAVCDLPIPEDGQTAETPWTVGALCTETDVRPGLNLLRVIDPDPASHRSDPFYSGRVEVEVGHFTAGRVGGFTVLYRGYFPRADRLVRWVAP